jgi:acetyltransferase-like isoleucine patch superfamily enzyme
VHIGDGNRLRAHEGTLRIGDKTVLGRENTLNCYLDLDIGSQCIVADWVYMCDFDHRTADVHLPIKDQGIVKSPVRIGDDVWVGVKASVLRGAQVGRGSVLAAHTVVRGEVPPHSVVAGVPGRVVRDRVAAYEAAAAERAALADMARKAAEVSSAARLG